MNHSYKKTYKTTSTRLQSWDYGWDGSYFITICTENMQHYFGEIDPTCTMNFSDAGKIAHAIWELIPKHFPYAHLGEFIIMPNHLHGIIIIDKRYLDDDLNLINKLRTGGKTGNKNPMLNENIARIIRWYKGRTTFEIRKSTELNFKWQPRYYDQLIRSTKDYINVSNYVINNPKKWINNK